MSILLPAVDSAVHAGDNTGRLDSLLEIPPCNKMVSMEGSKGTGASALLFYLKH